MALADIRPLARNEPGIAEAIEFRRHRFGPRLATCEAVRAQHAHSMSCIPVRPPNAVVFAETTGEVRQIGGACAGGGTTCS